MVLWAWASTSTAPWPARTGITEVWMIVIVGSTQGVGGPEQLGELLLDVHVEPGAAEEP